MAQEIVINTCPVTSVNELLKFNEDSTIDDYHVRSKIKIENKKHKTDENKPKVLLCHDLKGGYLDDEKCILGCSNRDGYRFWRWWQVDVFVYFSHNFITIPPTCWVDASHKHGVLILGTLITEWDDGIKLCTEFLEKEDVMDKFINRLVEITLHYNFDGWLLNIENKLEIKLVEKMMKFVEILTERLHSRIAHSLVIWYDSVTTAGELLWQNELNDNNKEYFNKCDGIFLNYTWKDDNLNKTMNVALTQNRLHDVFVGIDVFARGCVGKFDVCKSMNMINSRHMSSAIFAASWTFECIGRDDCLLDNFPLNETKFWNMLNDFSSTRMITSLPLVTTFCQGCGKSYYWEGKRLGSNEWINLSLQSIQPSFQSCHLSHCFEDAFYGGSCLEVDCDDITYINLFNMDYYVKDEHLHVTFAYKPLGNINSVDILLGFTMQVISNSQHTIQIDKDVGENFINAINAKQQYCYLILASNDDAKTAKSHCTRESGWVTCELKWPNMHQMTLKEVILLVKPVRKNLQARVLLGYLQISTKDKKIDYMREIYQDTVSIILSNDDNLTFTSNITTHSFKMLVSTEANQSEKLIEMKSMTFIKECLADMDSPNQPKSPNIYLTWQSANNEKCSLYHVFVMIAGNWIFICSSPTNLCLCHTFMLKELLASKILAVKIVAIS